MKAVDLVENAFRIPQISVFCCQINARIAADLLIKHASVRTDKGKHDEFIDPAEIDVGIAFQFFFQGFDIGRPGQKRGCIMNKHQSFTFYWRQSARYNFRRIQNN